MAALAFLVASVVSSFDYTALYSRLDRTGYHVSNDTASELAFLPLVKELARVTKGSPMRVFVAGCGTCAALPRLQRLSERNAYGMEASATAVAMAKELQRDAECREPPCLKEGKLTDIPWPDQSFDVGVSGDVLEHVHPSDVERSIAELTRTVRGTLVLGIASGSSQRSGIELHLTQRSATWWTNKFESAGWRRVQVPAVLWKKLWKRPSTPKLWNFRGNICTSAHSVKCGTIFLAFTRTPEHLAAFQKAAARVVDSPDLGSSPP